MKDRNPSQPSLTLRGGDEVKELVEMARAVREHAAALVTGYKVGAALEAKDGRVFTGANVESPSAIVHICAERTALFHALSSGAREFTRIAVIAERAEPIPPCGYCRQALLELAPKIEVIMATIAGKVKQCQLDELLPDAYEFQV